MICSTFERSQKAYMIVCVCDCVSAQFHPLHERDIYACLGADMEFVTSGTSGTCVKCFWAQVKFHKLNAKNYKFCEICQIQEFSQNNRTEFVLE